jgi:hypothetical protein
MKTAWGSERDGSITGARFASGAREMVHSSGAGFCGKSCGVYGRGWKESAAGMKKKRSELELGWCSSGLEISLDAVGRDEASGKRMCLAMRTVNG